MNNKKFKPLFFLFMIAVAILFFARFKQKESLPELVRQISPVFGNIQNVISTTGTVLPKNRLEIKPPVAGRIESILVREGQHVNAGETLAWISSAERAALIDSARGKGEEALKYWQEAYKPIPLLAPIEGEVIVSTMQPGQTVVVSDAVIVLSDYLIVRAQVDETDIGKIKLNQKAFASLDAYPDDKIEAGVEHIYYESETVNNVTIYKVDLILSKMPGFLRSGMNATIDFIVEAREKTLLVPFEAVQKEKRSSYVFVKEGSSVNKREVETGLSDDRNIEIISGLGIDDIVIIKNSKFILPKSDIGTNPFMPARRRSNQGNR